MGEAGTGSLRIGIVDDQPGMLDGLVQIFQRAGHEVVVSCSDGAEFVAAVTATPVDVAVVDIEVKPGHGQQGLTTAQALRDLFPDIGLFFITQRPAQGVIHAALAVAERRAVGVWDKWSISRGSDVVRPLGLITQGKVSLADDIAAVAVAGPHLCTTLSRGEMDKVCWAAAGLDTKAIAAQIGIEPSTVQGSFETIYRKLKVPSEGVDKRQVATNAYRDYLASLPRSENEYCPRSKCPRFPVS